jgi:hypothetical protein
MATYMPEDMQGDYAAAERRRQLAKLLQDQGLQAPQGQMVSGRYVAPSLTQYLSQGLANYRGQKMQAEADSKQKALAQQLQGRKDAWLQAMPQAQKAQTMDLAAIDPSMAQYGSVETAPAKDPSADEYLQWAMKGMQVDPNAAQLGMRIADRQEGRQAQREQAQAQREQRMQELQLRMNDARLSAQERQAAQLEAARIQREFQAQMAAENRQHQMAMARLTAATRPEPAPTLTTIQDPKDPARNVVVDARTGRQVGVAPPKEGKDTASKASDAKEALALIADAEKELDSATGSFLGKGVDLGAQTFGLTTPGAKSAAKLKAIEGMLVSKMPKMSGPQSDKDVALYRQMAAEIGDDTVPAERKRAALQAVKAIQQRYAGQQGASPAGDPIVVDW